MCPLCVDMRSSSRWPAHSSKGDMTDMSQTRVILERLYFRLRRRFLQEALNFHGVENRQSVLAADPAENAHLFGLGPLRVFRAPAGA